jgi:ATP-dependent RNA helicase DDX41
MVQRVGTTHIACSFLVHPYIALGQEERQYAIKSFKSGAKDVMVASGVASKGLDFNDIQHVIIFSMPKEIEDYVHQIGRTGRSGKTGIATTFVNMNTPEQTLLDLKYLLMEAGQKLVINDQLIILSCPINLFSGYHPFCLQSTILGLYKEVLLRAVLFVVVNLTWFPSFFYSYGAPGLGHGISNCPKLEDAQRRQMASHRTTDEGGGY